MEDWCQPNGFPPPNKEFTYLLAYYTLIYVLSKHKKIIKETLNRKLSFFTVIIIRSILHRRGFVIKTTETIKF